MASPLRFSVGVPKSPDAPFRAFARGAEELGFAGLWTVDHATGEANAEDPTLDALHTLSFLAGVTERIRLGVAVLVLPRRHPAQLARDLATLDRLSQGRLTLGVGIGRPDPGAAALGLPVDRPVTRLEEGIALLRAFWTEERVSHAGELFRFTDIPVQPKPAQRPGPPIWIGARSEPALRRAARIGDGWIAAGSTPFEEFRQYAQLVAGVLAAEGRDRGSFAIAKRVYIAVEPGAGQALERLRPVLDFIYRTPGMAERCAVYGTPQQCAQSLARFAAAGADELILDPLYDELQQLEALAEVVRLLGG